MIFKVCYLASIVFLCIFIYFSNKYEKCISKHPNERHITLWGWLLIIAGLSFSFAQFAALPYIFERQAPLGTMFYWFATFGIFSVLALRIVHGLLKCIWEIKKREN